MALKDTQNLLTAHEVQKVTLPIGLDSFALSTSLNTSRIAPSVDIDRLSLGDEGRFASMPGPDAQPHRKEELILLQAMLLPSFQLIPRKDRDV